MRQAARIAINRTVAGVHYPVDSLAGQMLGLAVGEYFIARATGSGANVDSWTFDGEAYPGTGDFTGTEIYDVQKDAPQGTLPGYLKRNTAITVDTAPCLEWLWKQAQGEWKYAEGTAWHRQRVMRRGRPVPPTPISTGQSRLVLPTFARATGCPCWSNSTRRCRASVSPASPGCASPSRMRCVFRALFDQVSNPVLNSAEFNFCVLLVHHKSAAELVRDPTWKQAIRSAELGPPFDLPNPRKLGAPVSTPGLARPADTPPASIWTARLARLLARVRSILGTIPAPTPSPVPAPPSPPSQPGGSAPGVTVSGQRVVTAVIDQGIAFAHSRFSHATGTRIAYLWQQDLMSDVGPPDISATALTKAAIYAALPAVMANTPGLELTAAAIDAGMNLSRSRGGDEEMVYRAIGRMNFAMDGFKPLARRRSHGTHVLDLAAGEDPKSDGALRPIIAVDMPEDAVGDPAGSSLTIHAAWGLIYILARAEAMRSADERLPVVVNISYGPHDGPHDGSSLFERFADALIKLFDNTETPLRIVLAAGNSRQSRAHARFSLDKKDDAQAMQWRLQPGGLTPSFMEIWLPPVNGAEVSVTLRSPRGEQMTVLPDKQPVPVSNAAGQLIGAEYVPANPPWWPRASVLLCIAPTAIDPSGAGNQPVAASGLWTVTVTNLSDSTLDIDAWIRRSDTPGGRRAKGRQSYFDDPNYERFYPSTRPRKFDPPGSTSYVTRQGTLSGIATGAATYVIGGYRRMDMSPAWYSSAGPVAPSATRTMKAPNWLAPSDDAPSYPGVLAAGTRSGARVAMNGTSAAAPQAARYYAGEFAAGSTPDAVPPAGLLPVSSEVPAADRPLVAGDGLMDLPGTRGRP